LAKNHLKRRSAIRGTRGSVSFNAFPVLLCSKGGAAVCFAHGLSLSRRRFLPPRWLTKSELKRRRTKGLLSPSLSSKGGEGVYIAPSSAFVHQKHIGFLPLLLWRRGMGRGGRSVSSHTSQLPTAAASVPS
jgi:hypothetical protein